MGLELKLPNSCLAVAVANLFFSNLEFFKSLLKDSVTIALLVSLNGSRADSHEFSGLLFGGRSQPRLQLKAYLDDLTGWFGEEPLRKRKQGPGNRAAQPAPINHLERSTTEAANGHSRGRGCG